MSSNGQKADDGSNTDRQLYDGILFLLSYAFVCPNETTPFQLLDDARQLSIAD